VTENEQKIEKACAIWHAWFKEDANEYAGYEDSDVEYFVGVVMYNQFAFSKALSTMKTMDIGLDFIQAADSSYAEVNSLIGSIRSEDELELLALLQNHIRRSLEKYSSDPTSCYLLNRLRNHIDTLAGIYAGIEKVDNIDFKHMADKST